MRPARSVILALALSSTSAIFAKDKDGPPTIYPVAIVAFQERGSGVKELGGKVTDLMFAKLAAKPELYLVDREDLKKLLAEQELNISGAVNAGEANKVGQLTGAKLLITGTVLQVDKLVHLIAKIIGTETSRVMGTTVKANIQDDLDMLVDQLADAVAKSVIDNSAVLVPKVVASADRVAALKQELAGKSLPAVSVSIPERHIGAIVFDPAAQTELSLYLEKIGFDVVDSARASANDADILITGEGMSELAGRIGNLVSVKARVEVKAVERTTGKVLASDRQTALVVDLTEQIAGKAALQDAAATIAERLLPKLAAAKLAKPEKAADGER
jgi:TolB-like protein